MLPASSVGTVAFDDVECLAARDFAVVYRLGDGRIATVAPLHIQKGTTSRFRGERGRLVLTAWYAAELGLSDGAMPK